MGVDESGAKLPPVAESQNGSRAGGHGAAQFEAMIGAYRDYLLVIANQELPSDVRPKVAPSDIVQDTMDEAEATARLRHPNICRVLEVGEEGPIRFLVVDYCDGPDLAEWLRQQTQPVPLKPTVRLFITLAEGVQHAHARGVLHRRP